MPTNPLLLCPDCCADRGLPADVPTGVVGVVYGCPVCRVAWEEDDEGQDAAVAASRTAGGATGGGR